MPRVMIIDDEETIRRGLQQLIGRLLPEWEVVQSCPDAESALASIEETDPDLAIIDISMTGMSGLELAAELERIKPGLYKMILTGHEKFDFLQTAMRHGVTDYLLKPLQREELVQAMRKVEASLQERQRQATAQLETLLLQWVVSQHRDRMSELLQAYADRPGERQPLRYSVLLLQWADPASGKGGRQLELTRQWLAADAMPRLRESAGIEVAEGCVLFLVGAGELPSAETWRLLLQRWQHERIVAEAADPGERLIGYGCSEPFDRLERLGPAYDQAVAQLRAQTGDAVSVQAGTEWQRRLAL
ncbi:response regulator, partial [Paenibacillus sp. 598K]|uniref:response regulator n=1 Tax=Paenibacillus sp. 598K TaxID=1117987 RepID=UPI000FFE3B05